MQARLFKIISKRLCFFSLSPSLTLKYVDVNLNMFVLVVLRILGNLADKFGLYNFFP